MSTIQLYTDDSGLHTGVLRQTRSGSLFLSLRRMESSTEGKAVGVCVLWAVAEGRGLEQSLGGY